MAKFLKHFRIGKKPPAPPTKDYDLSSDTPYAIAQLLKKKKVQFNQGEQSSKPELQEYTDPIDFRAQLNEDESDDLYTIPSDTVPPDDNLYSEPYEQMGISDASLQQSLVCVEANDVYDEVPPDGDQSAPEDCPPETTDDDKLNGLLPTVEYDEPWEWEASASATNDAHLEEASPLNISRSSSQYTGIYPSSWADSSSALLLDSESSLSFEFYEEESDMPIRHIYETAFDSKVKRESEDIDRLPQSPVLRGEIASSSSSPIAIKHSRETAVRLVYHSPKANEEFAHTSRATLPMSSQVRDRNHSSMKQEKRKIHLLTQNSLTQPSRALQPSFQIVKTRAVIENASTSFRGPCSGSSSSGSPNLSRAESPANASVLNGNISGKGFANGTDTSSVLRGKSSSPKNALLNETLNNGVPIEKDTLANRLFPPLKYANDKLNNGTHVDKDKLANGVRLSHTLEICPNCCQPIIANDSKDITQHKNETSKTFPLPSFEPKNFNIKQGDVFSCKCSLQSPENDTRPLGEYDLPWDIPKRFSKSSSSNKTVEEIPLKQLTLSVEPAVGLVPSAVPEVSTSPLPVQLKNLDIASSQDSPNVSKSTSEVELAKASCSSASSHSNSSESIRVTPPGGGIRKSLNLNFNSSSPNKSSRQSLTLNFGCNALNTKGEKVDPNMALEEQGWYHGSISRHDAENLLRVLREGSYLVRNSESSKQDYSLSLKSARGFMHMKIVNSENKYILGQFSKPFSSIPEMINHYSNNKLPIRGAEHMSLLYPVIDQLL